MIHGVRSEHPFEGLITSSYNEAGGWLLVTIHWDNETHVREHIQANKIQNVQQLQFPVRELHRVKIGWTFCTT